MSTNPEPTLVDSVPRHPGGGYKDYGPSAEGDKQLRASHWEDVAELSSGSGYDWDTIEVWRRKSDGKLLYEQDAGCSCYGPWESSSVGDLIELTDYRAFRDYVNEWNTGYGPCSATEVGEFLDTVRRALDA